MASNSVIVTTTIILFIFIVGVLLIGRSINKEVSNYSFIPIYFIIFLFIISNYTIGTNMVVENDSDDESTQDPQVEIEKRISNYIIVVIFLVILLFLLFVGGLIYIKRKGY